MAMALTSARVPSCILSRKESGISRRWKARRTLESSRTVPKAFGVASERAATLLYTLADAADTTADAAAQVPNKGGLIGPLAEGMEFVLKLLESGLEAVHVPYSYGFSIILLTLLVKVATYPLSKKQVESTLAMQALQPSIKEIQTRYKNDQERLQVETARLYKEAGVNPLAGCLPTLATIPVWIGLYRALQNAAAEGILTEGFFWIPSLAGPTSVASRAAGSGLTWLFPLQDGAPPVGWHDAVSYLVLPVLLIVSQYVSQKIISPQQSTDPSQKQANAILQFLPLMIGYFSLNVPSGLTLYWFTNNILTTAQQVYLRRMAPQPAVASSTTVRRSTSSSVSTKSARKLNRARKAEGSSGPVNKSLASGDNVERSDFFGGDSFSEFRQDLPGSVVDVSVEDGDLNVPDAPPQKEIIVKAESEDSSNPPQRKQKLSRKERKKSKKNA